MPVFKIRAISLACFGNSWAPVRHDSNQRCSQLVDKTCDVFISVDTRCDVGLSVNICVPLGSRAANVAPGRLRRVQQPWFPSRSVSIAAPYDRVSKWFALLLFVHPG